MSATASSGRPWLRDINGASRTMLSAGLWSRARKRRAHRKWRERKEHVGELVQLEGSFHDWLEGRGPDGCLRNMVDDASGDTLARLGGEETIWTAAGVLRAWVKKYGVPVALIGGATQ